MPGLAVLGTVLTLTSAGIDLMDAEPRAQLWVGAAAGAVFLIAVPTVPARAGEAQALAVRARLLIGAGAAAVLAVFGLWQSGGRQEPRVLLLLVPAFLLLVTALIGIREAARSGSAVRARQLRARLEGQEIERRRWAQELHDQTLQDLAAIEVRLAVLAGIRDRTVAGEAASTDPTDAADPMTAGLEATRMMVREQIRTLRHLIVQMRPRALDALGLAAALQDLAEQAGAGSGVLVRCEVSALGPGLAPDAEVGVYRIVQEAVTNALRHAACHEITITARVGDGTLRVVVTDDGIGLAGSAASAPGPATGTGLGRVGMAERAEALAATLTWTDAERGGTTVTLSMDL